MVRSISQPIYTTRHRDQHCHPGTKPPRSYLEAELALQIRIQKLPKPETEYQFHKLRKWRFDFAWPNKKLAVEAEGGTYSGISRHTTGAGFHGDCEKYNTATLNGWQVLRFDSAMIKSGQAIAVITQCLQGAENV